MVVAVEAQELGAVVAVEAVGAGGLQNRQHLGQRRASGLQLRRDAGRADGVEQFEGALLSGEAPAHRSKFPFEHESWASRMFFLKAGRRPGGAIS